MSKRRNSQCAPPPPRPRWYRGADNPRSLMHHFAREAA